MNWEAMGAIGEVLGAAGVIFSLLYLARQIRSSSLQEQRVRYDSAIDAITDWVQQLANEEHLAGIFLEGGFKGGDALAPEERVRFNSLMLVILRGYERVSQYSAEGTVHEWGRASVEASIRDLVALPGVQRYWSERRHWFADHTQTAIDQMIADSGRTLLDAFEDFQEAPGHEAPES